MHNKCKGNSALSTSFTSKIKDRLRYDHTRYGFNAPLEVKCHNFWHHQDRVIRLWAKFGSDTWKPCRDMSSLPVWRPPEVKGQPVVWVIPGWCHESMFQFGYDIIKELLRNGFTSCLGGFAVKFDWLSKKPFLHIYSAWAEDHIWYFSWRLDRVCGLWICTIDFDNFKHGGKILMFPWKIIY